MLMQFHVPIDHDSKHNNIIWLRRSECLHKNVTRIDVNLKRGNFLDLFVESSKLGTLL